MATSWSYVKTDRYKSVRELIHLLVNVVAKGGNLLLNIGPSPDGEWADDAHDRLRGIGDWMKVNGEAIYGTRPISPFKDGRVCLTKKKDDGTVYAIYLADENEDSPPKLVHLDSLQPADDAKLVVLGTNEELRWRMKGKGIEIEIPESIRRQPPGKYAWTIRVSEIE